MVELRNRRIFIDGSPVLVTAGEIHYFRLPKRDWEDRIDKLVALGFNTVASYVPWIFHEEREGQIDVTGKFRPENDLGAFIDLCHRKGLWFIPRPGPFVMAEMKNEGIPFWVYEKYPSTIPVSWNSEKATTFTLDYLSPEFLHAAEKWYAGVMPIFASRLQTKGGPIIGVQLDNEIGMLSWVSNQPDLSEDTLCDFAAWITARYTHEELSRRYPFDWNDPTTRLKAVRTSAPEIGGVLHRDLGDFERTRFARYVATLRRYAEAHGVQHVPFIVNIHGSGGGRGTQFPIGISQLYESYTQAPGYLSGSDHYLGDITRQNAQDLYYINAFMASVSRPEQPLSSMEFEAGSGDYGENGAVRYGGAAADFKVKLSLAQGNRLLNHYMLAGGFNPHLLDPRGDGNDRVATTGGRHGFAAPISPEGKLDPTYHALQETYRSINAITDKLADMDEEYDGIALAFIPDYYKTNFHRPGKMREMVTGLEQAREYLENLTRVMLSLGFRFPAIDIQHRDIDLDKVPCLAIASSAYLDRPIQQKLVDYVKKGGKLFLHGMLPVMDMDAAPCTILADALGLKPGGIKQSSSTYGLSIKGEGWLADEPEVRTWQSPYLAEHPGAFLRFVQTGEPCGIEVSLGDGKAIVLTCNYTFHRTAYAGMFGRLGAVPAIQHDAPHGGVLCTSVRNAKYERFLLVMNLDLEDKRLVLKENGNPLFDSHPILVGGRKAQFLPINVNYGPAKIYYSTVELVESNAKGLVFATSSQQEQIMIDLPEFEAIRFAHPDRYGRTWRLTIEPGKQASIEFKA